jgi:hypothetical protein
VSTAAVDTWRAVKIRTENLTEVPNGFLPLIQVPPMIPNKTEVLNLKTRKTQVPMGYLSLSALSSIDRPHLLVNQGGISNISGFPKMLKTPSVNLFSLKKIRRHHKQYVYIEIYQLKILGKTSLIIHDLSSL